MKSCGTVVTYIDWKKVKKWFFNIPLFIYQLILIVMGTVYGKFKWPKATISTRVMSSFVMAISLSGISMDLLFHSLICPFMPFWIMYFIFGIASYRGIPWRRIWRAAQASHVRLCLREMTYPQWKRSEYQKGFHPTYYEYINFGYPKAELQNWRMGLIDNKRFRYFDPTFEPSPEFVEAMIQYAHDQVGKPYDEYQLISNALHLIAWIVWPWRWGQEIVPWLNRPGGLEHCISGVTACLRDANAAKALKYLKKMYPGKDYYPSVEWSKFFLGYSTATTSPCLVPLSENWEER